jgi:hypothetical protein
MPSYKIEFQVGRRDTIEFPAQLLESGNYEIKVGSADGSVEIIGNRDGLLYLAQVLVRFAIGGYSPGFHAHLPLSSAALGPSLQAAPELTIYAPSGPEP